MIDHFAGARWWKFDFHTHTPASRDTPWFGLTGASDELSPEQWLLHFMKAGIDCVAITDHNTEEWIDRLREALQRMADEPPEGFRPLHLFPGVEISVNGGFHLLAIFDPSTPASAIHDLLVRVEYDGTPGDSDGVTRKSAQEVIRLVHEAGALAIPAHVDGQKGLLEVANDSGRLKLDANTVKQVLEIEGILAVEALDPQWTPHELARQCHCTWVNTTILGSDCHNFRNGTQPGDRFTWVKMCDPPNLEGLRLALLDGAPLSIRRSDTDPSDPNQHARLAIQQVEISNLRHAGHGKPLVARFSPWLSALIGGRGTGKSTVIEMLRLALGRDLELADPWDSSEEREASSNFDRIKAALLEGASVNVLLEKDGARFRITWENDGKTAIEQETVDGNWKSTPGVIPSRFPVRIFSQKQIFALAEKPGALLRLVDENVDYRNWASRWKELESRFLRLRTQIRELDAKLAEKDRLAGDLEDVKRQLGVFESGGSKDLLVRYQRLRRQRAAFETRRDDLAAAVERLRASAQGIEPVDLREEDFEGDLAPLKAAIELLEEAASKQREVAQRVAASARELEEFQRSWWQRVEESSWSREASAVEQTYRQLVERLRQEGVEDPSAYGALVQKRTTLERRLAEIDSLSKRQKELAQQAEAALEELEQWRLELTSRRRDFLQQVLQDNQYVRMSVVPFGDGAKGAEPKFRRAIAREDGRLESDILTGEDEARFSGLLADLYAELPEDYDQRQEELRKRVQEIKRDVLGIAQGQETEGRTKWFHNHVRDLKPEQLDRLELWWPEDGLRVEYRRRDGQLIPVEEGSPGQKSAAILAFVLSYGDEPLILDQPEDDLDNHLIYDLIVAQIRENKIRRQVIVATHNPNIVVNGDAEMVIAMDQRRGQCVVVENGSGCLQSEGVRDEVCRVMEGGRKAFEERYRRIIVEVRNV